MNFDPPLESTPEHPSSVSTRNGADILGYVAVLGADVLGRKAFQSSSFFLAAVFSGLFQLCQGLQGYGVCNMFRPESLMTHQATYLESD